jgi:PAS domain S-box-containing protein
MKALILADRPDVCEALSCAVHGTGIEPVLVATSAVSKDSFTVEDFPVIITTWRLCETDGLELCRSLRRREIKQRALMLVVTKPCSASDLELLLDAGADDYLFYPLEPDMISVRLRVAAQRAHNRSSSYEIDTHLRATVERLQMAVDGANDGLWDAQPVGTGWHADSTTVWYSRRSKQLLGFTDDEFPNLLGSWESRLHPDDHDRVIEALMDHLERRKPYDVEYRLRTKSGEYRWFSARGQAIWDERGQPVRMSGSLRDITQAKEDATTIEQSQAMWRSLVENAPDIIMLADLDGTIRFINRTTPTAIQSIGRSLYDYIDEPFKEVMRNALEAVGSTGRLQRFEVHGQTERGVGTVWYANRLGPVLRAGCVESVVLIATDISDRKLAEQRVQTERQLLRRLLDLQERERQLVSYEIHDGLVQYLTAGLMHLEAFANSNQADDSTSQFEYTTGAKLIRDGLAEARRLISGLRPPILDEQGVVAALEYLVNEARQAIPELVFINRASFTRLAAPLEVALFRITQEALTNIRKHSGAKSARVELLQHGDRVRLVIRDFGCGFDPKTVHEERFGLQGIRQRARLLGTAATIDSAPGKGTTVVVDFPIVVDTDSTANCEE